MDRLIISKLVLDMALKNDEKIKSLEKEAYQIFLIEGYSENWKNKVREIAPLKLMDKAYLDLL